LYLNDKVKISSEYQIEQSIFIKKCRMTSGSFKSKKSLFKIQKLYLFPHQQLNFQIMAIRLLQLILLEKNISKLIL